MNRPGPSASVFRFRALICTAFFCLSSLAFAQPPSASGDYTAAYPSVQRVEAEIKGTDATDTLARQVAVFRRLQNDISNIKYARTVRGPFTPGEQKVMQAYSTAEAQLVQGYTKSHTPDEVTAFNRLCGRYVFNQDLYNDYHRLIGQQALDTYAATEAKEAQHAQQFQERMQPQTKQQQDPMAVFAGANKDMASDPKLRRCLELGGMIDDCESANLSSLGKAAEDAVSKLIGVSGNTAQPLNGVLLVGMYHSRTDLPGLTLTPDGKALLQKCGTLVDQSHTYTLRKSGPTTQIILANEPDPIVLTLRPDGSLSGPGAISVKGQILTGYQSQSSCPVGVAAMNCQVARSVPVYGPSMQRCTIGQLAPQPPPPPPPKPTGLEGVVTDLISSGPRVPTIYGFRVSGPYASSTGMQLTFDNRFVTLDCGKAHMNAPYTVENTATGFTIHVQNAGGPFLLAVAPDNTLRGSGSTTVNGKLVSGMNGNVVNFTPHSETCSIGTFAPQSKQNTMRASSGPAQTSPAAAVSQANAARIH